jgi:hypothetical protein
VLTSRSSWSSARVGPNVFTRPEMAIAASTVATPTILNLQKFHELVNTLGRETVAPPGAYLWWGGNRPGVPSDI